MVFRNVGLGVFVALVDLKQRSSGCSVRVKQIEDLSRDRAIELQNNKQTRYWKARRSLWMWSIKGEGEEMSVELQRLLATRLRLGEGVFSDVGRCSIRRNPVGQRGRVKYKTTVEFPSVELRDVVKRAAYNLAGQDRAGMRLEIAHHLMANFKALNAVSCKLKKKFPNCRRGHEGHSRKLAVIASYLPSN